MALQRSTWAVADMYGGGGGESFFVMLPLAVAVFAVLWVPFWLIGVYRWRAKRHKGLPASKLLKASVIWPFAALLFSAVGGSISVTYGNGPERHADALASQLADHQGTPAFATQQTHNRRWEQCGSATYSKPVSSDGYSPATVMAAAKAGGWSEIQAGLPDSYGAIRVDGRRDHSTFYYELSMSGHHSLSVESCRTSARGGNGTAADSRSMGLDGYLLAVTTTWAGVFALGHRWWHWARTRSAPTHRWAVTTVMILVTWAGAIAWNIWIG